MPSATGCQKAATLTFGCMLASQRSAKTTASSARPWCVLSPAQDAADREGVHLALGRSKEPVFWPDSLRRLCRRGLRRMQLMSSEAPRNVKAALDHALPAATWRRCAGFRPLSASPGACPQGQQGRSGCCPAQPLPPVEREGCWTTTAGSSPRPATSLARIERRHRCDRGSCAQLSALCP